MPTTKREWALAYADAGWSIFPAIGKEPHYELLKKTGFATFDKIEHKMKVSTRIFNEKRADEEMIERWWSIDPNADVKLVCGRISGITVLDIDYHHPETETRPEAILEALGEFTMFDRSGNSGLHVYYRYEPGLANGECFSQVEVKNNGMSITIPPSIHPVTKRGYAWDDIFTFSKENLRSLPRVPDSVLFKAKQEAPKEKWDMLIVQGSTSGSRNVDATALVGKLLDALKYTTYNFEEVLPELWKFMEWWNQKVMPPFTEKELLTIFKSVMRTDERNAKNYGGSRRN